MRKIFGIIITLLICLSSLCGCKIGDTTVFVTIPVDESSAFKIGDLSAPTKEAVVYLTNFADYYGQVGDTYIWQEDLMLHTIEVENGIKAGALKLLSRVYALNIYAEENGLSLTQEQLDSISLAASDYYNGLSEAQKENFSVSESDIVDMCERYARALLVFDTLMADVDTEVSEDEARVMEGYVIQTDDADDVSQIESRLKSIDNAPILAQTYSQGEKGLLDITRGMFPENVEAVMFSMEDGQVAGPMVVDGVTYFVACANKYNEEKSEAHKNRIVTSRQQSVLEDIENEQALRMYAEINKDFWEQIQVKGDGQDASRLLFTVIESYFQ